MRAATGSRSSSSTGPGADLPLQRRGQRQAPCACCWPRTRRGALASTAAQVAAAIEAGSQGLIDRAHPYRTNAGTGIVQATTAPIVLTDFLDQKRAGAPAGEVPRGPFTVRALRIGKFRDGSKPGVLIQANDHAREWVPITITIEVAERLVRNYAADPETKKIVDNTDIFLIPSNNPDGANYSFYNFASQRRNMTNHCPDANADPARRNAWGVDLNRNYTRRVAASTATTARRRAASTTPSRARPSCPSRRARTSSGSSRTTATSSS